MTDKGGPTACCTSDQDSSENTSCAETRVLIVTKMWPTEQTNFRNGFLKTQVASLRALGLHCDVLITQRYGSGPIGYLKTARAVRRAVATGRYDVIHAHYGMTGATCLFQRYPLVVTLHGSDINGAVDHRGRVTLKGRLEATISRAVAHRADMVIAVSARMTSLIPRARQVVAPVGIDTEFFCVLDRAESRRELGLDATRPYVLFAANPKNPVKRYELARRAMALVKEQIPDAELLTVHGEPFERMPLWMNAADVLLITSRYEGGPMVHREAMACNLPVVSVDVGDVAFHLREVMPSHVVRADPAALSEAMTGLLVARPRSNGREHAEKTSTMPAADMIVQIYSKLVDPAPRAHPGDPGEAVPSGGPS